MRLRLMVVLRTMVSVTVKERGDSHVEDGGLSKVDGDGSGARVRKA